ncbi:MAG: substrate-binding periplasmic protein [Bacillota bacterium]
MIWLTALYRRRARWPRLLLILLIIAVVAIIVFWMRPTFFPQTGDWPGVQQRGVLRIVTTADYPPFEYLEQGQLRGFDIDLVQEVALRLGVTAEIQDVPFEKLLNFLEGGEADLAVACLRPTPERAERVDFTQSYYPIGDHIVCSQTQTISVGDWRDLRSYRIAVLSGSTQEEWLRAVKQKGDGPLELHSFDGMQDALAAIATGSCDLLLVTAAPPEALLAGLGLRVCPPVPLIPDDPAMAVSRGADELREKVDAVIVELQADGTIARLCRQYLLEPPS